MFKKYTPHLVIALLLSSPVFCQDKPNYALKKTYPIAGPGGWDYIAVNKNKLYVSHGTQVNILDEKTGDSIGIILNTAGVHGIAFCNELNRGYTSNGRTNNVTVFDLTTTAEIAEIASGKNPDAILYEPFLNKIITCNGGSKDLSVIDPKTNKVIATIALGGKPETAVTNGKGRLYVNIEDKNEIVDINLNTFTVSHHWSIAPAEEPTGLAIDVSTGRLFAGCDKLLMIIDADKGKIMGKMPIGSGCDGVAFDNKNKIIFTSNGEGTVSAVKEVSANDFQVVQTIASKKGARTIALDQNTHTLFLPTADFEAPDPNATAGKRPKMIPGTFQVLVIQ